MTQNESKNVTKKNTTNEEGVFYKRIINDNGKEADKTFVIRYADEDKDKLKVVGKYSQGIRISYCKQIRNEILNKIRLGEQPPVIAQKKKKEIISFDEFAQIYFNEKEDYVKDIEKIKRTYEIHIKTYLGDKDVDKITANDIKKIQKYKRKELAERTINAIIQIIGAIYNIAISKKIFKGQNPVNHEVKRIKVDNKRERYLEINEITTLIEKSKKSEHLYLFTLLALRTGGRLGTILSLTKKDIKLETNDSRPIN